MPMVVIKAVAILNVEGTILTVLVVVGLEAPVRRRMKGCLHTS